ncbi:sigma-54-dependent transcriptional regulator [Rhodopirellula sp. MGV]|uniref:sigma-54-dependent transcriptional regulator n=1 Tax=Rhodopirellula sp. MGV TaxID=2023130 RepID=UPI000B979662|nr:sigma-54 dependent transcriptional regulator [Rhodopirellula sp. MGV]OYP34545.1 Fis family transcriptional regulator [Rhodopirellula sp. MGV]PNY36739.1 sigma-54-dependent Fis family transcriptional regulator [Rhodopirellula baltica]
MRLLVIDDEPLILEAISMTFPDDDVVTADNAQSGIDAFVEQTPDVVLCDIRMPDITGMEIFEKIHRIEPKVPIILMTGQGTAGTAIEAMQRGAFEYVLKPLDPDTLIPLIENATETSRMARVPAVVPDNIDHSVANDDSDLLIGSCPQMQEVYRSIGRVTAQDVTVLILGESGTGKEVIARAIYQYSSRSNERFLPINCAAIPEQLLESELFGHEKGAFTGADRKRVGKFELCNNGTLFLDEIGDMTPLMQTKILRVLQDQSFERVGGSETIHTNARLIAATNVDLELAMEEKRFRSDLFYRLNIYTIRLPPLRDRGEDILELANYFGSRFSKTLGKEFGGFASEAVDLMMTYAWPGNVRELQSAIKHALLQATAPVIVPAFLPESMRKAHGLPTTPSTATNENAIDFAALTRARLKAGGNDIHRELVSMVERQIFAEALEYFDGNLTQAAKRLGITRTTLRSRLESLQMSVERQTSIQSK